MNPDYPYPYTITFDDDKEHYRIYDRAIGEYVSEHKTYKEAQTRLRFLVFKTRPRKGD